MAVKTKKQLEREEELTLLLKKLQDKEAANEKLSADERVLRDLLVLRLDSPIPVASIREKLTENAIVHFENLLKIKDIQ